ncbi:inovirus Gp2 family protein [Pseudomonas sp. ERGC3:05]|nr:inovirus Gp2 family protein [Pseudomonas sp. ERGC3:01]QZC97250.1 inovirus Gp2 family protein [Pseudomonas sp. ERGC3:05]
MGTTGFGHINSTSGWLQLGPKKNLTSCPGLADHYIWHIFTVEQGEERGHHIHTAFFFDGAKVRSDVCKTRQIGRLWESITGGVSYYYSYNADEKRYGDNLGIGLICQGDACSRGKVHKAIHYLAKDEDTHERAP